MATARRRGRVSLVAFDFDNTLIDGDAGVLFARDLTVSRYRRALDLDPLEAALEIVRLNATAARLLVGAARTQLRYELGEVDRRSVVETAYQGFEGLDAEAIREAMRRFAREELPDRLRDGVVEQLEHHVDRGDHVAIVSTGIHDLIWPLKEAMGWDDVEVVACRLLVDDGRLTGRAEGPLDGNDKLTRLRALAKRRDHDLDEAWAYGDHENDAVVLEHVGNPVAVHPTARMLALARRRGWPILYDT